MAKQFIITERLHSVIAAKKHTCEKCGLEINIGDKAFVIVGYNYGKYGREYQRMYFCTRNHKPKMYCGNRVIYE